METGSGRTDGGNGSPTTQGRVVPASLSNSCRTALIIDMNLPPWTLNPEVYYRGIVCGMRKLTIVAVAAIAAIPATDLLRAASEPPAWAYAIPAPAPAGAPAAAPDTSPKQLPGSTLTFTRQQISDGFGPAEAGTCSQKPDVAPPSLTTPTTA